jgi:adenylyltransferase/sulfurtransferase
MDAAAKERYSRQIRFAPIGEEGQAKLLESRVAIVGCGALGSFQAGALARAGVGTLDIIDRDYVELSNLQRQWLFEEQDAIDGLPKAIAAARRIARINSTITVNPVVADVGAANVEDLLAEADVILDATDNFETRYLINDYAIHSDTPWIYGAAVSSYGLVMAVLPGRTSCLKCVYPEPPTGAQPTCETAGVVNTITSLIASLQVSIAYQILVGRIDDVPPKLTTVDVWTGAIRQMRQPQPAADCQACAKRDLVHLHGRRRTPVSLCGRNAVQIHDRARPLDLEDLEQRLKPLGDVRRNDFALRFFLPAHEMTVFPDGRAIIKGTTDIGVARSLYARYIGA